MRLSACFLSCLLLRPQTASALQRNTRPSTHDAPLSVYGQETVTAALLPHHRAGKVSFFSSTPVKTTTTFYCLINALTDVGTNKTMFKDSRRLKFLFPLSKNRQIPVAVLDSDEWGKELFHGQKRIFSCRTTVRNHERARYAHLACSSRQSE